MTPQSASVKGLGTAGLFARIRFIMVSPSHPGNVGSAARAIKTMGFGSLHIVAPHERQILQHPDALALASGAADVLQAGTIHADLPHALAPCTLSFGMTARPRALGPQACDIRSAAETGARELARHPRGSLAFVLGTERNGLSNSDLELCHHSCHIPANPAYSSLNLAQAMQVVAWEMRYALLLMEDLALLPDTHAQHDPGSDPATSAQVQALLAHFEQALLATGFLDPQHPKKLMQRLRQMWVRNRLSIDEVDMLRGMCKAMIRAAQTTRSARH